MMSTSLDDPSLALVASGGSSPSDRLEDLGVSASEAVEDVLALTPEVVPA
jgi:hypothetical protein